jgi:hypothetical protein
MEKTLKNTTPFFRATVPVAHRLSSDYFLNALISPVLWIQIWIGPGSMREKMTRKCRKQLVNFESAGCSLLRVEGFSCSLDVLYEGLEISNCNFDQKRI